jgi:diacylglycerol kinase
MAGVAAAWKGQVNFRLQVLAALAVSAAAVWLHFEAWRWAVLLVTIALVLACELLNTALEDLWNAHNEDWNEVVGRSKDASAGAVGVVALMAIGVGVALFWEPVTGLLH